MDAAGKHWFQKEQYTQAKFIFWSVLVSHEVSVLSDLKYINILINKLK